MNLANKWAGEACTLNGKPAKITGRLLPFATVSTLDGEQKHEWSWQAVDYIMTSREGKFKTKKEESA